MMSLVFVFVAGWSYWGHLMKYEPAFVQPAGGANGWWFALLGPRTVSGAWLDYLFPTSWLRAGASWFIAFTLFQVISLLAFPLAWMAMIYGAASVLRPRHDFEDSEDHQPPPIAPSPIGSTMN